MLNEFIITFDIQIEAAHKQSFKLKVFQRGVPDEEDVKKLIDDFLIENIERSNIIVTKKEK